MPEEWDQQSIRNQLDEMRVSNQDKANALAQHINDPVSGAHFQIAQMRVRLDTLTAGVVGDNPQFELDYENNLAAMLDSLAEKLNQSRLVVP